MSPSPSTYIAATEGVGGAFGLPIRAAPESGNQRACRVIVARPAPSRVQRCNTNGAGAALRINPFGATSSRWRYRPDGAKGRVERGSALDGCRQGLACRNRCSRHERASKNRHEAVGVKLANECGLRIEPNDQSAIGCAGRKL